MRQSDLDEAAGLYEEVKKTKRVAQALSGYRVCLIEVHPGEGKGQKETISHGSYFRGDLCMDGKLEAAMTRALQGYIEERIEELNGFLKAAGIGKRR